jgi:hypothetical protein
MICSMKYCQYWMHVSTEGRTNGYTQSPTRRALGDPGVMYDKMNIAKISIVVFISLVALIGCNQDAVVTLPEKVKKPLFVPKEARNQKKYELNGSYQVSYKTAACWPGDQYIDAMVSHMSNLGWKRRDEDFLNPGLKMNSARDGSISEEWSFFGEKGKDVHQWIEDWEDSDKNIVRYGLKYRTERKNKISITPESCDLEVVVIFIPQDIRKKSEHEVEVWRQAEAVKDRTQK